MPPLPDKPDVAAVALIRALWADDRLARVAPGGRDLHLQVIGAAGDPDGMPLVVLLRLDAIEQLAFTPALGVLRRIDGIRPHMVALFGTEAAARCARRRLADVTDGIEVAALADLPDLRGRLAGWPTVLLAAGATLPDGAEPALRRFLTALAAGRSTALCNGVLALRDAASLSPDDLSDPIAGPMPLAWDDLHRMVAGWAEAGSTTPRPLDRPTRPLPDARIAHGQLAVEALPSPPRGTLTLLARDGGLRATAHVSPKASARRLVLDAPGEIAARDSRELIMSSPGTPERVVPIAGAPRSLGGGMLTCYLNRGGAGNPAVTAFARGCGARLHHAEDETSPRPGIPVVWGVLRNSGRVIRWAEAARQYWFYIDHAYFARGHGRSYRISRNAYEAGPVRDCPPDRAEALGLALAPWRRDGASILVCPPTDFFMAAHDCHGWLERTLATLRGLTDRPIEVRDKPIEGQALEPLADALARTHALVTHSSNAAIEAVMAGVPVFVAPTSAAAPVGQTDLARIEHPLYPDRERWRDHLAFNQFSIEEMRSGEAWRLLLQNEDRAFL